MEVFKVGIGIMALRRALKEADQAYLISTWADAADFGGKKHSAWAVLVKDKRRILTK